ncbi:DUF4336 domain-containing protein [Laspinema sp. A4]|uniref:DUF4336 domain-containing protein n=1 Tax=Laspinema sp. D2d TaxID=2953686 RepID=UPI0021BB479C|nr:DUF4336 domain-containing protein [Laspinema sp. D2d]MCT7981686.1 DUF4336 domain-containing protein [Laspinema sp. D2d]
MPLYPYGRRRTLCQEVVKDTLWTFEQIQGILYVVVPIRMTVVRLERGGLLVYAPIAPTPECVRQVQALESQHGPVKYIILPTVSGLEHKVFVGPFARRFPLAQVFVAPSQWSFPLNLPLSWLGLPQRRTQVLPRDSSKVPFADEFDYEILGPIDLGLGRFGEVAFFHRSSRSLLVTDTVLSIPEDPPAVVQLDPYPLLFHARDNAADVREDTPANRRQGWQRICLFAFYFSPSTLNTLKLRQAFQLARKVSDRSKKAYFGIFPFDWQPDWKPSFDLLRGDGRLFVAPILQTLILNRAPKETLTWADTVARWQFERIVPCHLDSPLNIGPHAFRQAFNFLESPPDTSTDTVRGENSSLSDRDFATLRTIDELLDRWGITPPRQGNLQK